MKRLCSIESPSESKNIKQLDYANTIDRMNRVMGYYHQSQLMQPRHNYFIDKQACMIDLMCYKEPGCEKMLCYPKLSGVKGERLPRANPYRKYQLARSHTARTIKMIKSLVENFNLSGFRFAFMTLTMPKELSVWLSYQKNGNDIAWRMFGKFWKWYEDYFGPGLAASVNLHTWKSEIPIEPHYHFHCLIPNYMKKESGILDVDEENTFELVRQEWHRQRGGNYVPVSEDDLSVMKMAWWKIIVKVCKMHHVDWYGLEDSYYAEKLDIHFSYATWEDVGKVRLMHWFNYQGRYPLEDYAKYSNKHLDCPNPAKWLEDYENHNRAFGWWKIMRKMVKVRKDDKVKLNPVTGNEMEYMGRLTVYELIELGHIGFLEIIRGKPVFHRLSGAELNWLISVQRDLHPGKVRAMMYDTQAGDMEER